MRAVPVVPLIHTYTDILAFKLWYLLPVLAVGFSLLSDCIGDLLHVGHEPSSVPVLTVKVLADQVHTLRAVCKHHPVPVAQLAHSNELDVRVNASHCIGECIVLSDKILS